jgi:ornithine cyclodeaminase/alanine dehydrogenase
MDNTEFLFLSRKDVEDLDLEMNEIIDVLEVVFQEKGEGRVEMPPKPGIHPKDDAFIHAMPAYIPKMEVAGMKWVSGFPDNFRKKLSYIAGLIILNNTKTGFPFCVMDCTWVTAKRTGAATAVAAKFLGRKDSRVLGIIGCGVQGRSNLEGLITVMNEIEEVKVYDIVRVAEERYVKEMKLKYELNILPVKSAEEAVRNSDIIVTAGPIFKNPNPAIEASWLNEGVLSCPIDFDSYWKPEAINLMDKFCTDDFSQLEYYKTLGYFSNIPEVYADIGEIVANKKIGRENEKERIMIMNLGLAIEDIATALIVYKRAKKKGIGTWLPL